MTAAGGAGTHVTPAQAAAYNSFMRTHSMSETARELGRSQIRVREMLVQYERNLLRDAGVRPPTLKEMLRGDVTTRFGVSRDLRQGRPAKHPRAVAVILPTRPSGGWRERPAGSRIVAVPTRGVHRLLITGAERGAPVHAPFLANLQAYARHLGAEILALDGEDPSRGPLAPELRTFAERRPVSVGDKLDLRPDVALHRVARAPLEGLERASPGRWAAFVHPAFQLDSLPRLRLERPRIHMTTGVATRPAPQSPGGDAPGALIVELSADGAVHVRHLRGDMRDGSFHDLDARVASGRVATGLQVEAIVYGDVHHSRMDDAVARATWGDDAAGPGVPLVDRLRPRTQVIHDICHFHARSHHDRRDHHARFARHVEGNGGVRREMAAAASFLGSTRRPWGRTCVVHSNHDQALGRWLREADHRTDPENAEFLIDRERAMLARLRAGVGTETFFAETMRGLHPDGLDGVRFLTDGESLDIAGVECGLHGHAGADGAPGARWRFERLGLDLVLGHSHRPTARGGVYTAGVCQLDMGYNRGPTTWAIAHVAVHASGARQHLIMDGGRFTG